MAVRRVNVKTIESMSETDKQVLHAIYTHRCLTEDLLYRFFYKSMNISRDFTAKRVRWMIQHNLIEPIEYGADLPALFLTTQGIETYRYIEDIPVEVLDPETGTLQRALKTAADLKMKSNNIRHQIALSTFHLMFDARSNHEFFYSYVDEKFIRVSAAIRPDGLIQMNNADLFLEMDMGTERRDVLLSKWNHYREFLKSKNYRYKEKKTIMLFIVNNVKLVEQRRAVILSTLQVGLLDALDSMFEIYVDTPENLLDIVFRKFTPNSLQYIEDFRSFSNTVLSLHQFVFSASSFMTKVAPYSSYMAYIRKLDNNRHILVQDGRPQEFLFDSYLDRPLTVLHQITAHRKICAEMIRTIGRKIPYLVLVSDEKSFYQDLTLAQCLDLSDVYFTTRDRLASTSFPEALFQYDGNGNLFHFRDFGMQERVFERTVKMTSVTRAGIH